MLVIIPGIVNKKKFFREWTRIFTNEKENACRHDSTGARRSQMNTDGHRWEKTNSALRSFKLNLIEFELSVSISVHLTSTLVS